ncbi:MAG: response regulator [Elusimicrobiota bacterium]
MEMTEKTYTTHDIATFCGVYPSSVVHWINDGKLKSYQTPGGHHRVTKEDLLAFLRELKIPIPRELMSRARILIVDDDAEVVRVIARAFSRVSALVETDTCRDGVEALIRIGQETPDLVILDLVMPKMDGLQVCRVLKSTEKTWGVKIIAITGKKPPYSDKKLSEMKADALFRKPLDLVELVNKSGELLKLNLTMGVKK